MGYPGFHPKSDTDLYSIHKDNSVLYKERIYMNMKDRLIIFTNTVL